MHRLVLIAKLHQGKNMSVPGFMFFGLSSSARSLFVDTHLSVLDSQRIKVSTKAYAWVCTLQHESQLLCSGQEWVGKFKVLSPMSKNPPMLFLGSLLSP